jgi:hypothetical protein
MASHLMSEEQRRLLELLTANAADVARTPSSLRTGGDLLGAKLTGASRALKVRK